MLGVFFIEVEGKVLQYFCLLCFCNTFVYFVYAMLLFTLCASEMLGPEHIYLNKS